MSEFILRDGSVVFVDDQDDDLMAVTWHATLTCPDGLPYIHRTFRLPNGRWKSELLHRVILGRMTGRGLTRAELTDHWNRNTFDNRRRNLRLASNAQNQANAKRSARNSTGYKGVTYVEGRSKPYHAQLQSRSIGYFSTAEDAHTAYCNAARERFGEFANPGVNHAR